MGRGRLACLHLLRAAQSCLQSHGKALHTACLLTRIHAPICTRIEFLRTHIEDSCDAHHFHSRPSSFKWVRAFASPGDANNGDFPVCKTCAENSGDVRASFDENSDASCPPTLHEASQSAADDGFMLANDTFEDNLCGDGDDGDDGADAAETEKSKDMSIRLVKSKKAMYMLKILKEDRWSSPDTETKLSSVVGEVSPTLVIQVIKLLKNAHVARSFLYWARDQDGYEPQAEAFTHLIARFGRERDFNSARSLLVEMKCEALPVDYAFSIFIHRLKRARRPPQELVKAMCEMASLGVTPTIALYTSALEFLLKVDRGVKATDLYMHMLQSGLVPDKKLYELLIVGYSRLGKVDEASSLFNEMQYQGYVPHVSVYSALVGSLSVARKLDKGKEIYTVMTQIGSLPRVFEQNEIACALHGQDTMEMIEDFLKVVDRTAFRWRIHSHNNLLQCLLDTGKYEEAMRIFNRIPHGQTVKAPPHKDPTKCYWNLDSYRIMIFGLCKLRQFDHALEMFRELLERDLGRTNDISSFLLFSLSDVGRIDEALSFCKHITRRREVVSIDAQHCFFTALRTSGHLSVALKIFISMKKKGCIDEDSDFVALIGLENRDEMDSLTV